MRPTVPAGRARGTLADGMRDDRTQDRYGCSHALEEIRGSDGSGVLEGGFMTVALCNDGTLWHCLNGRDWYQFQPIPQPE